MAVFFEIQTKHTKHTVMQCV